MDEQGEEYDEDLETRLIVLMDVDRLVSFACNSYTPEALKFPAINLL